MQPQLHHCVGVYVASSVALWLADTMELCGSEQYEILDVVLVSRANKLLFGFMLIQTVPSLSYTHGKIKAHYMERNSVLSLVL